MTWETVPIGDNDPGVWVDGITWADLIGGNDGWLDVERAADGWLEVA